MMLSSRSRARASHRSFRPLVAAAVALTAMAASVTSAAADLAEKFGTHATGAAVTVDHTAWDEILKAHIKPGPAGINLFDYAKLKAGAHGKLKGYIAALEQVEPAKLSRNEQFAFWANLYNAKTIDIVVDHYPVDSIRKISINEGLFGFIKKSAGLGGPWNAKVVKVAGEALSLDNIEHDIMRKVFKDPRVHYAVNCASIGCPNLNENAFTGANLEAELDKGAVAFVNSDRGFKFSADGAIQASSIYSWFQVDFGGTEQAVLAHAAKYANTERKPKFKAATDIAGFDYDWNLNDTAK
jgi:hypothetical protein